MKNIVCNQYIKVLNFAFRPFRLISRNTHSEKQRIDSMRGGKFFQVFQPVHKLVVVEFPKSSKGEYRLLLYRAVRLVDLLRSPWSHRLHQLRTTTPRMGVYDHRQLLLAHDLYRIPGADAADRRNNICSPTYEPRVIEIQVIWHQQQLLVREFNHLAGLTSPCNLFSSGSMLHNKNEFLHNFSFRTGSLMGHLYNAPKLSNDSGE